jgi:glutamate--cysteine ligase
VAKRTQALAKKAETSGLSLPKGSALSAEQLLEVFANAHSPIDNVAMGYELTSFRLLDGGQVYYDRGIKPLLLAMAGKLGLGPSMENHILISLDHPEGSIGYGPGSQLRLDIPAGPQLAMLHARLRSLVSEVTATAASLGIAFSTIAFHPDRDPLSVPIVTKRHYPILQKRIRASGTRGLAIITSAAQCAVRISAKNEADAVDKFRAGVAAAPYLQAIFANSPIDRGIVQPVQSVRTLGWLDVDRARTKLAAEVFAPDFGYASYAAWALSVPALGLIRSGRVIDTQGRTFAECLVHDNDGITPFPVDWLDHLHTMWPAVRWDDGIELRVTDTGTPAHALALAAMWKGLLGQASVRAQVIKQLRPQAFGRTLQKCARDGLWAQTEHGSALAVARDLVRLAKGALPADEKRFVQPVELALAAGLSPADELRQRFGRDWTNAHQLLLATRPVA